MNSEAITDYSPIRREVAISNLLINSNDRPVETALFENQTEDSLGREVLENAPFVSVDTFH